jgi:hypothetical protein
MGVFGLLTLWAWFTSPRFLRTKSQRLFRAISGQVSTAANNQLLLEETRIRAQLLEKH